MFTGIVQAIGRVSEKKETDSGLFLKVQTEKSFLDNLKIGASVAVNGVCLTVTEFSKDTISFDVIPETLRVTNLETILINSE